MGLDQYVYFVTKAEKARKEYPEDFVRAEDMYFRKNRHLEGYMARIWEERGNTEVFNCKDLELTKEDIEGLTKDALKDDHGFFWGEHELKDDWEEIEKFKERALEELKKGNTVIYTSWW